jgi:chitin disaccharide deacetylase
MGRLHKSEIMNEIERQLDAFQAAFGEYPDFIDGHQHIHVLPVIRGALLLALKRRNLQGRIWLRDPSDGWRAIFRRGRAKGKAGFVKILAFGFHRQARRAGFKTNQGFSGFSAFDPNDNFDAQFQHFCLRLGQAPLIMCHPGYKDDELIALNEAVETRSKELIYLSSGRFIDLIEVLNIELVPNP